MNSIATNRLQIFGAAIVAGLALSGCTEVGQRARLGEEAANPAIASRQARYHPVVAGFTAFRPVGPVDWRRTNERVAPNAPAR
ncbi:hypothetical protein, partial [Enterobacter hormaechei]|uniref:hypothetical protein n=1 Tax=Enterobacter hormaechei TaxID=158836 RepID=UPI0019544C1D